MNVVDYCNGLEMELTAWKAKMYDAIRKMEKLPSADKEKVLPYIQGINIVITEMEDKIGSLKTECPSDWSPQKKEIDSAHIDMRSKYEETMELIGKAAPVSIPG
jgi:hypothetical protein